MERLFVCDTCSVIHFFSLFGERSRLSQRASMIFEAALQSHDADVRLSIPSTVFLEIYEKWLTTDETIRRFFYDVFTRIVRSPNIEIKPIEPEVLQNMATLGTELDSHDMHDKIILASAMMLRCPLISSDGVIAKYNQRNKVVPDVFY